MSSARKHLTKYAQGGLSQSGCLLAAQEHAQNVGNLLTKSTAQFAGIQMRIDSYRPSQATQATSIQNPMNSASRNMNTTNPQLTPVRAHKQRRSPAASLASAPASGCQR